MEKNKNVDFEDNEYVVSLQTLLKKLKKYLSLWIVAAILLGFISLGIAAVSVHSSNTKIKAIVSFSYDGIEKGLDPNGQKFDANTLKNPAVIEMALKELDIDISNIESIRNGISIEKIMPQNAYNKFTIYNNILENGGGNALTAGEKILETSYYPTQFTVIFDYSKTSFTDIEATNIFNTVLEKYDDYFYNLYGYNDLLGNSFSATSYTDYDYIEAVDIFQTSFDSLERYVRTLASKDKNQFRSSVTGYTFDDLYESVRTIKSLDLDRIVSYTVANNVTKNKDDALVYYDYQLDALVRRRNQYNDQIRAYNESIEKYEKEQLLVLGNSEETNIQTNVSSEKYDEMFSLRNDASASLASVEQQIDFYRKRQQNLMSGAACSKENISKVEASLAALNEKLNKIILDVQNTADDYYKNEFNNSYNILAPASAPSFNRIPLIIENIKTPLIILEAAALLVYLAASYVIALLADRNKAEAFEEENKESEEKSSDTDKKKTK